ncbi:MAG TPA: thymidine phosphorylase [Balneolales bacterium]|nr:thymidine phosphorylase [Balneolales bacterium]
MQLFNMVSLIRKKRDGEVLSAEEIGYIIESYTKDRIPDYQMSAFLMASYLKGLNDSESAALTKSMLHSGQVLDLSDISGVKVDKHSTGGVGDKVSLLLAPIVASCGVPVPMISGRGLGHTGGTLDKLESITGYNVNIDLNRYREILKKHNMVMAGQTEEIAPADKRIYSLRDVTATVECIPLIASSIMSKKLAEGIDALVLDVKYGSGAFMKTVDEATKLAQKLVSIGEDFGKRTIAYLTNMNEPLGYKIGNWLEVEESIDGLKGNGPDDLMTVTYQLAGTMIYLGGEAESIDVGVSKSKESVASGKAYQKFLDNVEEQGGKLDYVKSPGTYPKAGVTFEIKANQNGNLQEMKAFDFGVASLELGAGRHSKEEDIDPTAGIVLHKKVGNNVKKGETIVTCYTNNSDIVDNVRNMLNDAITISDSKVALPTLISHRIDKDGILQL